MENIKLPSFIKQIAFNLAVGMYDPHCPLSLCTVFDLEKIIDVCDFEIPINSIEENEYVEDYCSIYSKFNPTKSLGLVNLTMHNLIHAYKKGKKIVNVSITVMSGRHKGIRTQPMICSMTELCKFLSLFNNDKILCVHVLALALNIESKRIFYKKSSCIPTVTFRLKQVMKCTKDEYLLCSDIMALDLYRQNEFTNV